MTAFDEAHRIVLGHFTVMNDSRRHIRQELPENPRPWSRVLATCHGHELRINRNMEFYDRFPPHGGAYLGRARSDEDAVSRWKNHLLSMGVRVEDAEVADG